MPPEPDPHASFHEQVQAYDELQDARRARFAASADTNILVMAPGRLGKCQSPHNGEGPAQNAHRYTVDAVWTVSQVNKAGRVLRAWLRSPDLPSPEVYQAFDVLFDYRAAHRLPLTKANNGLRSVVRTEDCEAVEVSQRLKRLPTILGKLVRQPTMALASMQDIGGCRAILASIDEVRRVQKRLLKNRPAVRVDDYIEAPRTSGYRGIHVIVQYDERSIEVQLRTRVMHDWAVAVERLGGRIGEDLKSGLGPLEVLELFEAFPEAMAVEESGGVVQNSLMERINQLRQAAQPYLKGGA